MPRSIDLNLIPPLRALLEERSVSKAAERIHMSQPALSASLSRLRIHFNDQLLVRSGNRYEYKLTPLGVQLLARVYSAELSVERLFTAQDFDPETSTHVYTVATSDYSMAVLGGSLASVMRRSAPHVSLRFENITVDIVHRAPDSLRDVTGALLPHGYISVMGDEYQDVFVDRWVCVTSPTNEVARDGLTFEMLSTLPWVSTFSSRDQMTPPERQMRMLGIEPLVEIGVPSFLATPEMIAGTDRIAFLPYSYARRLEQSGALRVFECPFDAVPFLETFWWSAVHSHDPEHLWFREQLRAAVEEARLTPAPPPNV
ncbi:MAG: Transcriptional regulator, lysR-family [Subtercola sp.]|nr:Transcriptional regulator, lysR-family [Subtercola sp.]